MEPEDTNQEQQDQLRRDEWDRMDAEDNGSVAPAETTERQPEAQQRAASNNEPAARTADSTSAGAAAAEDDPYAGLPAAVREEILGLKSIVGQFQQRLRQAEGNIGGLKSQRASAEQQAIRQASEAVGDKSPTAAEVTAARKTPEGMRKLAEEYPEFGAALQSALTEITAPLEATIADLKKQIEHAPVDSVTRAQLDERINEMSIESVHRGWKQRVAQPSFVGWLRSQAREVQGLAASSDPQDAIRLLDLHSESIAGRREKQTNRLTSAAAIPSGRSSAIPRARATDEMTAEEYWAYLDEQDKQQSRQGA